MKTKAKIVVAVLLLLSVFSAGVTVEHWRMDAKIKKLELDISLANEKAVKDARKLEQQRQATSTAQRLH